MDDIGEMDEAAEHEFDAVAVCIFCDLCDDEMCCPTTVNPCERSTWMQLMRKGEVPSHGR